jgi:hypothetical protein
MSAWALTTLPTCAGYPGGSATATRGGPRASTRDRLRGADPGRRRGAGLCEQGHPLPAVDRQGHPRRPRPQAHQAADRTDSRYRLAARRLFSDHARFDDRVHSHSGEPPCHRLVLVLRDARVAVDDEVALPRCPLAPAVECHLEATTVLAELDGPGSGMPHRPGLERRRQKPASVAPADPHRDMGGFQSPLHDTGQVISDRI